MTSSRRPLLEAETTKPILDMVVNNRVVVEIKATEQLHPSASAQLFSYLCSTDYEVGLLLHFGHKAEFQRVFFENRLKARRGRA